MVDLRRDAVLRRPDTGVVGVALSLAVSTGASAVLGVVFWLLAARLFDSEDVGRDAALIAAMLELSTIAQLNLDNALLRFLPESRDAARRVGGAYALSGTLAVAAGVAFVLVAPSVADDFAILRDGWLAVAFVVGLVGWGVFALQDAALTAMRRATWVPVENVVFGVLKVVALPIAAALALDEGVYLAWIIPMALVAVPLNVLLFRRVVPAHRPAADGAGPVAGRRTRARFLAQDYAGVVLGRAGAALLPLVVVAVLGASANAYFYIPLTMVTSIDMMVLGVATSVLVEGAYAGDRLSEHVRTIARRFGWPLLLGVALLVVAAPVVLLPFGEDYAREGAGPLRLLALACLPRALVFLASAAWRVERHGRRLLAVEAVAVALLAAAVVPMAHAFELPGVALAWLAAWAVPGAASGLWLWRFARPTTTTPHRGDAHGT